MTNAFTTGYLKALEAQDGERMRTSADIKRAQRIEEARDYVRPFAGDHLDIFAMSAILLREEHGPGKVTPEMVYRRCRQSYPESFV